MFVCRKFKITQIVRDRNGNVRGPLMYRGNEVTTEIIIDSGLVKSAFSDNTQGRPAHSERSQIINQFNYAIAMMPKFYGKKHLELRHFNELKIEQGRIASLSEHLKYLVLSIWGEPGAGLLETKLFKQVCRDVAELEAGKTS